MKFKTAHCLFEQSGTFKNEFKKLGYDAYDYDIQNEFGETDFVIDLFNEIDDAYSHSRETIFDRMDKDNDIIFVFYPCVYFSIQSELAFTFKWKNYKYLSDAEIVDKVIERSRKRQEFYERLLRFVKVCIERNLRMLFENPFRGTYLRHGFIKEPSITDSNRMKMGDYFEKSTAYWFFGCEPENNSINIPESDLKEERFVVHCSPSGKQGVCSTERSQIAPEYAKNFIKRYLADGVNYDEFDLFNQF